MSSLRCASSATRATSLALLAVLCSAAASADETETLTLNVGDLSELKIDAGAGFLDIEASTGDRIELTAEIIADEGDYRLTLERKGDRAVLVSDVEPLAGMFLAKWARINLTLKVPARMALDIDDDSGYIKLHGMRANATIDDGSGEVIVRDHLGDLYIDDGSGEIDVSGVTGNVKVEDGSGPIKVSNVIGNVVIKDGSGSMEIDNIDGHVTIRDGSGSIDVSDVKRGLTIPDSGSGKVRTRNVTGNIERD
jgi:DUF4097 and DUF4098 domain-containing protein YvlB